MQQVFEMFQTYLKKKTTKNGKNQFVRVLNKHDSLKSNAIKEIGNLSSQKLLRKGIIRRSPLKKEN